MSTQGRLQIRNIVIWMSVIAAFHFALGTQTHLVHGVHIVLAGLFLVPVLMAAVAFERYGALLAAAAVSILYLVHLLWTWHGSPMGNADQYAWLGIYPIVGFVSGHLVRTGNAQKQQLDLAKQKLQHSKMINGLTGLLTAVNVRDDDTVLHCRRVAAFATAVGRQLGLDQSKLSELRLAALVHDIGKVGIPDAILFKHGRLDDNQMAAMRQHVEMAVSMLQAFPGTDAIARLVAQHHESPDGSGYPNGLTEDAIEPAAAILKVADIYAALTEARPYHEAMTPSEAIDAMSELAGTKIDSTAFSTLCQIARLLPQVETVSALATALEGDDP